MRTLTNSFFQSLLVQDFNTAVLQSDARRRNELASIDPVEIETLIERLKEVHHVVLQIRSQKQQEAVELLKGLVGKGTGFNSVEELIEAAGGMIEERPTPSKKGGVTNNRIYRIELLDSGNDERRGYSIVNGVIPPTLKKDPVYVALLAKNPELEHVDELLMAFSPEYQESHPINAKYEKETFHINTRGKFNRKAMVMFSRYKKKVPEATPAQFRELVMTNYKDVT